MGSILKQLRSSFITPLRLSLLSALARAEHEETNAYPTLLDRPDPGIGRAMLLNLDWMIYAQDCAGSELIPIGFSLKKQSWRSAGNSGGTLGDSICATAKWLEVLQELAKRECGRDDISLRTEKAVKSLIEVQSADGLFGVQDELSLRETARAVMVLASTTISDKQSPLQGRLKDCVLKGSHALSKSIRTNSVYSPLTNLFIGVALLASGVELKKKEFTESAHRTLRGIINNRGEFVNSGVPDIDGRDAATILRLLVKLVELSDRVIYLHAAERHATLLLEVVNKHGLLPARFNRQGIPLAAYATLDGSATLALACEKLVALESVKTPFVKAALSNIGTVINQTLRRTLTTTGHKEVVGGLRTNYPSWEGAAAYEISSTGTAALLLSQLAEVENKQTVSEQAGNSQLSDNDISSSALEANA